MRQARRARYAALALTGAVASVMFLPLATGTAGATAGFSTVQAGGPPSEPRPARYVSREKPVLHNPRWRPPNIDVYIHNGNESRNDRRHKDLKHEDVKPDPVKDDSPDKVDKVDDDVKYEPDKHENDNDKWWWPEELS
ncbi:hypothetical protein AB0I81_34380 [Nonomuraea sp. NPDC050404]|uniref:hypothetical protein n=1 Tax=Nonomuraea sp. NPDC050404 TaxID=3155783 RepID=UPI003401BE08